MHFPAFSLAQPTPLLRHLRKAAGNRWWAWCGHSFFLYFLLVFILSIAGTGQNMMTRDRSLPMLVPLLEYSSASDIVAGWLVHDWCLHLVLQRPCREFLKSSSMCLAWLGFWSLESMMQWLLLHIKVMALRAAVAIARRKTWHLVKFPTNNSKVSWKFWYVKGVYLIIRIWKDQFLWRLEPSFSLFYGLFLKPWFYLGCLQEK